MKRGIIAALILVAVTINVRAEEVERSTATNIEAESGVETTQNEAAITTTIEQASPWNLKYFGETVFGGLDLAAGVAVCLLHFNPPILEGDMIPLKGERLAEPNTRTGQGEHEGIIPGEMAAAGLQVQPQFFPVERVNVCLLARLPIEFTHASCWI